MQFNDETPRSEQTIQGSIFSIPTPFVAGHVCTENEAGALNQLLIENTRNNFAAKIKKAAEAGKPAPGQSELDAYLEGYEFGERSGGGGRISDPVAKEAMEIARNKVKEALAKKGHKVSDIPAKKITELAQGVLAKYKEEIMQTARTIVASRQDIGAEELEINI